MEKLINQIRQFYPVSPVLQQALEQKVVTRKFEKGDLILKEGQICHHFNFIHSGLVRSFYYHDGKDKTYWFYREDQFFTSWYSFFLRQASYEYLEALETAEILSLSYNDYQELAEKYPDFSSFARRYTEIECATIDYYTKNYLDISAKEKYKRLISEIPNIVSRVKLGHVASFLGISQETLSRIRAERT